MSKRKVDRSTVFSSLMGEVRELAEAAEQRSLPLDKIVFNPRQPRKYIGEESLAALTESVRQHGVIEPVLVRTVADGFELVAGERRTRAALAANLKTIPTIILELNEVQALEISVIENLQREDLNPVEETDAILNLVSIRLNKTPADVTGAIRSIYDESRGRAGNNVISDEERDQVISIFKTVGRFTASSFYTNRIPILSYPDELLEAVRRGQLHYTKAKKLARITDEGARKALLKRTLEEKLSVTELDKEVRNLMERPSAPAADLARDVKRQLSSRKIALLSDGDRREVNDLLVRLKALLTVHK